MVLFRVQTLYRQAHNPNGVVVASANPPGRPSTGLDSPAQAGLVSLAGPGIVVRLKDARHSKASTQDAIVHDVDLLALVNELWALGAEAVAINDERIVARSSIRCAGPTILVNTARIGPPYTVRALGPKSTLEAGLRMPGGWADSMKNLVRQGGEVKILTSDTLLVPAYHGPVRPLLFASPTP